MDERPALGSSLELSAVLERVASVARELGGTPSAVHKAAQLMVPRSGYTWSYSEGTATISPRSGTFGYLLGRPGYVISRLSHQAGQYRHVVEVHADHDEDSSLPQTRLPWQLLPSGEYPFERILEHLNEGASARDKDEFDETRLRTIYTLGPAHTYVGIDQFSGYVAFYFAQRRTAVLDCPKVGNAIYVLRGEEWSQLCRLTKKELLRDHPGVERIIHRGRWLDRLKMRLDATSGELAPKRQGETAKKRKNR